jgi:iron(III) transport system permease protein
VFPEIRSLWGAAWVFTFALYPYVYLLARTALGERASHLMEAARLLGAPLRRRILEVALPLARPAVAAGAALALMETLADFGVSSYFGIQTFTAGIYKAWLSMDNRIAAAQLATLLLLFGGLLLFLERAGAKSHAFCRRPRWPRGGHGCAARGIVGPCQVAGLAGMWRAGAHRLCVARAVHAAALAGGLVGAVVEQFGDWATNSLRLGALSAVLAVALALVLAFQLRRRPDLPTRLGAQLVGLGYAVPGAVIVVGLLLPVGWLQASCA